MSTKNVSEMTGAEIRQMAGARRTVDVAAEYAGARTCECGGLIECLEGGGYAYWAHVKRMRIEYDHAAVPVKEER